MEYVIWLTFNNQETGFPLPINPPSIEISDKGKGKTYEISSLGEINVIKDPGLTEYAFQSIFPATRYPFVGDRPLFKPRYYVDLILEWMTTKRPIRFVFTGPTLDINTPASIEDFQWKEVAGSGGDIEYSLKLKKYVFYAAQKTIFIESPGESQPVIQKKPEERPNDKQPPKTYKLQPGEGLIAVAKKQLGDDSRWREIQKLNNLTDAQLKKLPIGLELKLPQGGAYA